MVEPEEVPLAIDELPLVALLGCFAEGETIVRGAGDVFFHRSKMRSYFGLLRQDSKVGITQLEAPPLHDKRYTLQQGHAGNVFVTRIRVGEVNPDITFTHRAKQRIHKRV